MADTFFSRLKGLLGRTGLDPGHCLVLKPCKSIHTLLMKFPIDIIFLSAEGQVVNLATIPPFRFSPVIPKSHIVLELPAGTLEKTGTSTGDTVIFFEE